MPLRLAGIGAERQAWRAEETLRGLGGRPARPRGSAGPLSARQMEVARLVADGTPTEIRCARRAGCVFTSVAAKATASARKLSMILWSLRCRPDDAAAAIG